MRITADFTQLHSGENLSRRLKFFTDEQFYGKKAKLGFITPMGNIYFTRELSYEGGQGEFIIPSALLDGKGQLLCQLFMWDETGFLGKSPIAEFTVYPSVDDRNSPVISEETGKSLALIFEYLENKADLQHHHDGRYFTKDEIARLSEEKSNKNHTHNDLYYTESETDALLSEKCDKGHTHDDRYYTGAELDGLLSGKSDAGHTHPHDHNDEYYTEAEVDLLVSEKSDRSHVHDGRYYTKESIDSMLAGSSYEGHTHDDRYYTQAELNGLLSDKSDAGHTHPHDHNDVYYTESEVDGLLSGKSDTGHTHPHDHNDVYYTESEVDVLLSGKSDAGHTHPHNHDTEYAPLADYNSVAGMQKVHSEIIGQLSQSVSHIADFVVEEGTSGDWSYRKWASGVAECWAKFGFWGEKVSNTAIRKLDYNASLPFEFAETPTVFAVASAIPDEAYYSVVSAVATSTHLQSVALIGYTSSVVKITEGFISIHITGRWQ